MPKEEKVELEGEVTGPDKPAFVVADVSRLWVQLDVRQEDVERLRLGQTVTFESSSTGQQADGVLRWVSAEVDPRTRTVKARAEDVKNPYGTLRPATFGRGRVHLGKDDVVTVRHRDSMAQDRVKTGELAGWIANAVRLWKRPARAST